jgi:hypothetical protein
VSDGRYATVLGWLWLIHAHQLRSGSAPQRVWAVVLVVGAFVAFVYSMVFAAVSS